MKNEMYRVCRQGRLKCIALAICLCLIAHTSLVVATTSVAARRTSVDREQSEQLKEAERLNRESNKLLKEGRYDEAFPLVEQLLEILEKAIGSEHPDIANTVYNLAWLCQRKGDYAKAELLYRRAVSIREKALGPEHPDVTLALNNLATLYESKGHYAKAEAFYQRALSIWEKSSGTEHPNVALALNNLAAFHIKKGDYEKTESLLRRALEIREKRLGPDHPLTGASLNDLAILCEVKGEIARAIDFRIRGNEIIEQNIALNLAAGSERQKLLYVATLSEEIDLTVSLHAQSAKEDPAALKLALTTVLRRKGQALEAWTNSIAAFQKLLKPQDRTLLDQLSDIRSQLATLMLTGPGDKSPAQYQAEVKQLEEQIEKLEAEISRRSSEFRAQSQPVMIETVQAAIPSDAALLEFISFKPFNAKYKKEGKKFGAPRYVAYVLGRKGEPAWVDLGEARDIDAAVDALRRALRDPARKDIKQIARAADAKIMQPVRKLLGQTRRVLLSPDGALNLIPFGALADEQNRYLVEQFSFTYLTSGRDLLRLQARAQNRQGPTVIADPDYGERAEASSKRDVGTSNSIDFTKVYFKPLPGTAEEAQVLKAIMPAATMLTKQQATEAAVKQVAGPSILHIATHGFFLEDVVISPLPTLGERLTPVASTRDLLHEQSGVFTLSGMRIENPLLRSGLGLAGAKLRSSGEDDGVLTALEVSSLDLWGTKLVALSACDTGVGEVRNGDGVYGLRRSLFLAGSESQVMSLWSVSDTATRDLMVDYYKGLQAGEGRSEALRQVQLRMLASKDRQHPFYWASFIQSGEWANMDGKR